MRRRTAGHTGGRKMPVRHDGGGVMLRRIGMHESDDLFESLAMQDFDAKPGVSRGSVQWGAVYLGNRRA